MTLFKTISLIHYKKQLLAWLQVIWQAIRVED